VNLLELQDSCLGLLLSFIIFLKDILLLLLEPGLLLLENLIQFLLELQLARFVLLLLLPKLGDSFFFSFINFTLQLLSDPSVLNMIQLNLVPDFIYTDDHFLLEAFFFKPDPEIWNSDCRDDFLNIQLFLLFNFISHILLLFRAVIRLYIRKKLIFIFLVKLFFPPPPVFFVLFSH